MNDKELLEELKIEANLLGITYAANIGKEALSVKIDSLRLKQAEGEVQAREQALHNRQKTAAEMRQDSRNEAGRLVRATVVCRNPAKVSYPGDVFDIGNSIIGSHRKLVPFNVPYHIPKIILEHLQELQCQIYQPITINGIETSKPVTIQEYSVTVLPPLTVYEMAELAEAQKAHAHEEEQLTSKLG